MATTESYELVTVQGDFVTCDALVWRRYKIPAYGVLERLLDANPHLALLHKQSCFLPVGTQVRIPIDQEILKGRPPPQKVINIYAKV
jgi:phage tail protein X